MLEPILRFPQFYDEWEEKKMRELCTVNQGLQIAISQRFTQDGENRYFYITNEFLKDNSSVKYYIERPPKTAIATPDDILMTRTGNTGIVITNVNGCFHNNFFRINFNKKELDKYFLYYFLKQDRIRYKILALAGNSTIPDLNHKDFYSLKIKYPCKQEQHKIANLLCNVDKYI
ncbi:MAG: restriction endonuclease subunit S, partial [Romboutsia timonensis]|uniref:restriction endonuclease subunit S n=1 Tax=Romboutsia timonensis TaxID=1776391 RepID=UPI002A75834B